MRTARFLNALRDRLVSEVNTILARGERTTDGCVTALEEDTCRRKAKRIHSINAELAQLGAQPTTKGRRGRLASEEREELEAYLRKQDPEPQPAATFRSWSSATHEAGHGVVAERMKAGLLGLTLHQCTYQSMNAVVALAGAVAERMAGFDGHHSESDLKNARSAIVAEGWKDIDQQIGVAEARAKEILSVRWPFVQAVAAVLYRHGQLTGDQVRAVMRQAAWAVYKREGDCLQDAQAQRMTLVSAW